jgi:cytochrome bd-type quinol oxidase subunit 1
MNQVQRYIQESQIQAQKTIVLTYFTIIVALSSVFLAIGSFYVSWWQLRKEKQKENRWFFRVFVGVFLVILLLIGYEFWVILS